jgi:hypothetical protein
LARSPRVSPADADELIACITSARRRRPPAGEIAAHELAGGHIDGDGAARAPIDVFLAGILDR